MLTMTACAVFSQNASRDTMCLPRNQVIKAIRAADSLFIMRREVAALQDANDVFRVRIKMQDSTINDLSSMSNSYSEAVSRYKSTTENLIRQRDLQAQDMTYYIKELRRQKRKTAFMGLATAIGIAATIFLMK